MIRKFNYTGRRKIERSKVPITVYALSGNESAFSIDFNLGEYDLPQDAHIFVEAYIPTKFFQRFSYHTVGKIEPPKSTSLVEIGSTDDLLFRVKVVDQTESKNTLIAIADKIAPRSKDKSESRRQSLLPVRINDIGDVIWKLSLDEEDKPTLEISDRIPGLSEVVRTDREFHALVLPEIFKKILYHALNEELVRDPFEEDDMWHLWVRFACNLPGVSVIPDDEVGFPEWILEAVNCFGRIQCYVDQYYNYLERRHG